MKTKRRCVTIIVALVIMAALLACNLNPEGAGDNGHQVDTDLVGRWSDASGSSFEFKSDNTLAVAFSVGGTPINYEYEASSGTGKYWAAGAGESASQPFTYGISGSTLALSFAGLDYTLTKEGAAPKSVYAIGTAGDNLNTMEAYYWKDNVPTKLATPAGATRVFALAMYTVGATTYITGMTLGSANDGYWANGVWHSLSGFHFNWTGSGNPFSLAFFSGSDIYMVGYKQTNNGQVSGYYKNGVWYTLAGPAGSYDASPMGIAIDGNDVYIYGSYRILNPPPASGTTRKACYWKNDTVYTLTGSNTEKFSIATAICVSGADIRIAGYFQRSDDTYTAGYWKNGTWWKSLKTDAKVYAPQSIEMDDSNAYVAYTMMDFTNKEGAAGYFKSAVMNPLPSLGTSDPAVFSLIKETGDLYLGGGYLDYVNNSYCGGYWKNGDWNTVPLPTASAAQSIVFSVVLK